jgi:dsDNA-specific endonuclease/ATPase MutS2
MVDKTLSYLDYIKLTEIIFHFSSTPYIESSIHQLRPLQKTTEIKERQDRIEAVLEVIKWDGKIPLSDIPDIRDVVRRLTINNSVLEAQDFMSIAGFLRPAMILFIF